MAGITNQQILKAIKDSSNILENSFDTKLDIKLGDVENKLSTKIDNLETRLTNRIASNQKVNINHHLETRKLIGDLNERVARMSEGLARAAGAQ